MGNRRIDYLRTAAGATVSLEVGLAHRMELFVAVLVSSSLSMANSSSLQVLAPAPWPAPFPLAPGRVNGRCITCEKINPKSRFENVPPLRVRDSVSAGVILPLACALYVFRLSRTRNILPYGYDARYDDFAAGPDWTRQAATDCYFQFRLARGHNRNAVI